MNTKTAVPGTAITDVKLTALWHLSVMVREQDLKNADVKLYKGVCRTAPAAPVFLADPGEARGCSINSVVINGFIH